ncbi:sensor histidine kinase [Bryobacter aggregatus]|uniref:sensor histidine kinase n=1 Tax=Bryobacter aggregatus TaxID=360054 RepID=UPI0004E243EE|nr:HAMP domain-containing sensor histidine kinase [Bryobacter aggregatus]
MRRLRDKLLLLFLLATLAPMGATLYVSLRLLNQSLDLAPITELEESTTQLEASGKLLYQTARELLREKAKHHEIEAQPMPSIRLEEGEAERVFLDGADIVLLRPEGAYRLRLGSVRLSQLQLDLARSRELIASHQDRNWKRGFFLTLASVAGGIWVVALLAMLYFTARVTQPIQNLTRALREFAAGKRNTLAVSGRDEVAEAITSFNDMSEQIERSREKLLYFTRLESWQMLARKMAHEVKNSLTPIRLTVEEMVARSHPDERPFLEQASQIVTDEVQTLERRVRAFGDFSSEPPLMLVSLDVDALVEERVAFLKTAHPEVIYRTQFEGGEAVADPDLLKGILTNLLENAADAVGRGGVIRVSTETLAGGVAITIEDSGPGLSLLARESLFQPTISFKRTGMGLGLSIAKRSAVLMGGDLEFVKSSLGGAAFRLQIWQNESLSSMTKKILAAPFA